MQRQRGAAQIGVVVDARRVARLRRPASCAAAGRRPRSSVSRDKGEGARGERHPIGALEDETGIGERRDHQPVPIGQHLVVEPGPHPPARAPPAAARGSAPASASVASSARAGCASRLRIVWPSQLPPRGHVVEALEQRRPRSPSTRVDLGFGPDVEFAFLVLAVGVEAAVEAALAGGSSRVRASRSSRRRAARRAGRGFPARPGSRGRPVRRCRTASSRNAAPASAHRWHSGHSRRRDGRRCRPG